VDFYLHPQGICESKNVGKGTRIYAFAHVLSGARIGKDCNICDHVFIENDVVIGDYVTIKCGVQLWDGITIEDQAFIGPNVTFANDQFPRSKRFPNKFMQTLVCKNASIGANATILPGITIGQNSMIGAGSVVTRSVPPNAIVYGNPARIKEYIESEKNTPETSHFFDDKSESVQKTSVRGVTFHKFPLINDLRGDLSVGIFERDIPFVPKRYFLVFNVLSERIRGEHAHKKCHQFMICVKGALSIVVEDGFHREEFRLNQPNLGLYVPPMIWAVQYKHSQDAVLLVYASEDYDPEDYIREYDLWRDSIG
jgi:UDP-2-acetamido-3-amino-2,3-dideoxy-glucuronate N-acetyltransferase